MNSLERRFWSKLNKTSSCWLWIAGKDKDGYGRLRTTTTHIKAHRFSYELHKGPITQGLLVCHSCDNPPCVNPDHLFLGTYKDNAVDRNSKNRQANIKGELNSQSKLIQKEVDQIRYLYDYKRGSLTKLAKKFNTSSSNISKIINYQRWKISHE